MFTTFDVGIAILQGILGCLSLQHSLLIICGDENIVVAGIDARVVVKSDVLSNPKRCEVLSRYKRLLVEFIQN